MTCSICKNQEKFVHREKVGKWELIDCLNCDFQFWWPMEPEVNLQNSPKLIFDKSVCEVLEERHKKALKLINSDANMRMRINNGNFTLLDIGCRGGAFLKKVGELGIETHGIDLEKDILALAQKHHGLKNLSAISIYDYAPAHKKYFDTVTAFEVLEHIGDPKKFINVISQVLKPQGSLILSFPNYNRLGGYPVVNVAPNHWTRWTGDTIKKLLENNNFTIKKMEFIESSPRQIIDLLNLTSSQGVNIDNIRPYEGVNIVYPRKSFLRRILDWGFAPIAWLINKMEKSHTILVIAQKKEEINLAGQRIFVAGGAGFIGSNFIHYLLNDFPGVKILNYDKLTYSGNIENLADLTSHPDYQFVKGDITDKIFLHQTLEKFQPDYIINFAAETHVDRSIHVGSEEFIKTNTWGVFNFLEFIKDRRSVEKYLQVSTDEVYGSLELNSKNKFREDDAFAPNIPYSATKAGGDLLCRAYYSTWKVPVVVTHCSNNYGPYQYPEKLIPFFITRALENKKLPLYGDGQHVRDWIYVLDHCKALLLCLVKGGAGEVYNIGTGNEKSNLEIAKNILKVFEQDESMIEFIKDRPGHDRRYAIDSSKIEKAFNWQPETNFEEGFSKTIQWYRDHQEWINNVRQKTGVFNPHIDLWKGHINKL